MALADPASLEGRKITINGEVLEARPEDYAYAEALD